MIASPPLLAADGAANAAAKPPHTDRGQGSLSRKKASGGHSARLRRGINFAPSVFPGKERILFPKPLRADAADGLRNHRRRRHFIWLDAAAEIGMPTDRAFF